MSRRGIAMLAGLMGLLPVAAVPADRATLLVPARSDSAPPESAPAPLLIPGRPNPVDTTVLGLRERAVQQFQMGRTLEAEHRSAPAIVAYRNALRFDPDMRDANYRMGRLFLTVNEVAEAMQCFAAEVQRHPDHLDAARELGLSLARLGDHARAIEQLERLAQRHPGDGRNWHALGFAYRTAKRPRNAETALRRAIRLPPADAEEHRDLGALLAELGREREARAEYARAITLGPRNPSVWLNLGNLERRAGRLDSAMVCYAQAEARDSSFSLAYRGQVDVLRERDKLPEAGEIYRRWLDHCPEEHGARLEAINLFTALGRRDQALEIALDGVERAPGSGQPFVLYGMALAGQGRTREGLSQLRRADRLFKSAPEERQRVRSLIAALRAAAPDSLREVFRADSAAHARDR